MSSNVITRRAFLDRIVLGLAVVSAGSAAAAGCGGSEAPAACGATGLTPEERTMRTNLAYAERSTDPMKTCANCALYQAPAAGAACGSCQLRLGPVAPNATCSSFAARG